MSINALLTLIVLVIAAVVIGGVLLFQGGERTASSTAQTVPAEVLRKPDSHTLTQGPGDEVTVVEFLDYQCPSCASFYRNLTKQIEREYAGRITFVPRSFPLDMHELGMPAARAAEAAALQGKYQEMYHALFDNYESWAVAADGQNLSEDREHASAQFDRFARQIGLDLEQFHRDMASPQVTERIERDKADGKKAGVSGTPTIFINGRQFEPSGETFQDVGNQFRAALDEELAR
ncbi:DsbA family protein [Saccharopolyspora griseoalba]|uniref:DsbA family protein n=1 Tax=Saccharopolyspora griseoalba TaxID=1431848 RepID=A0ABW2LBR2_9PSEU